MVELSEMQQLVEMMYEKTKATYPGDILENDYDRAVEVVADTLQDEYGLDLKDEQVKQLCIRFYAALCTISTSATDDGLDDWLGVCLLGAALGAPEET
jgi:hypothetical protein